MKIIISTAPKDEADGLATKMLEEKLVACVNVVPGVKSRYWWKGKLDESEEAVLLMKTTPELAPRAVARLVELHSYDVPEAVVIDIESGHKPYLDWIAEVTRGG